MESTDVPGAVFAIVLLRTLRMDRAEVRHLAELPLDTPGNGGAGRNAEV
jgi:hypothetical protein